MIDFHSHFLPEFDDGAKNIDIALEMLRESKRQGVQTVISTSHCRPHTPESVEHFIKSRDKRIKLIRDIIDKNQAEYPKCVKGCEFNLCTDVSDYPNLDKVCVEHTNYLLLEMPYTNWYSWMPETIYDLTTKNIRPVMAHIERFLHQTDFLEQIFELDVLYQVNAESFLDKRFTKQIKELMQTGRIQVIGSDMHNTTNRVQNMAEAKKEIIERFGEDCFSYLQENAEKILKNEPVEKIGWKTKKNFFSGFFRKK